LPDREELGKRLLVGHDQVDAGADLFIRRFRKAKVVVLVQVGKILLGQPGEPLGLSYGLEEIGDGAVGFENDNLFRRDTRRIGTQ